MLITLYVALAGATVAYIIIFAKPFYLVFAVGFGATAVTLQADYGRVVAWLALAMLGPQLVWCGYAIYIAVTDIESQPIVFYVLSGAFGVLALIVWYVLNQLYAERYTNRESSEAH